MTDQIQIIVEPSSTHNNRNMHLTKKVNRSPIRSDIKTTVLHYQVFRSQKVFFVLECTFLKYTIENSYQLFSSYIGSDCHKRRGTNVRKRKPIF